MKVVRTATGVTLAMTMALTLAACGNGAQSNTAATTAAPDTATAQVTPQATPEAAATYVNDAFGISFTAPDGWNTIAGESLSQLNTPVKALTQDSAVEFVSADADGKNIVIVGVTQPTSADSQSMAAEQYLDSMVAETVRDLGGNYAYETTMATVTFNGLTRELPCAITKVTLDGNTFVLAQAAAEKDGHYLEMTVMGNTQDDVLKTFENFSSATS